MPTRTNDQTNSAQKIYYLHVCCQMPFTVTVN